MQSPTAQPLAAWNPTRGIWETTQFDLYGLSAPFSAIWLIHYELCYRFTEKQFAQRETAALHLQPAAHTHFADNIRAPQ